MDAILRCVRLVGMYISQKRVVEFLSIPSFVVRSERYWGIIISWNELDAGEEVLGVVEEWE